MRILLILSLIMSGCASAPRIAFQRPDDKTVAGGEMDQAACTMGANVAKQYSYYINCMKSKGYVLVQLPD